MNGLLLLRRRDVMALGGLSRFKFETLVDAGALKPLPQKDPRAKRLFPENEVRKVLDVR